MFNPNHNLDGQTPYGKTAGWIWNSLVHSRLHSVWAYLLLAGLTVLISLAVVKVGWIIGLLIAAGVIGGPFVISALFKVEVGVYLMITIAILIGTILKLAPGVPIGLLMDFVILLIMLGILYKAIKFGEWSCFQTPITLPIFVWAAYNFLQVANPEAASVAAWFYVMRPAIGYILFFFAVYGFMTDFQRIKRVYFVLIGLMVISALWGIRQFLMGYAQFEMIWVMINDAKHLLFINGRWRSFGTMGSPAQFGVFMAIMIMNCMMFLQLKMPWWGKTLLIICIPLLLLACVWSGTRSGFAVFPVFGAVLVGLARNVKLYALAVVGGIALVILINTPTDNYHIQRIQSTFKSEEDESFKVREENRKMIMPWIAAHPFGGGMGSTGVWGMRFSPGTFLSSFAPDSGFIRVAVEMGWIGLILYLYLWGAILWKGVFGYWRMKDPQLKVIVLTVIASICPIFVVEYAQDIVGKLPANLVFWVLIAAMFRAMELDKEQQQKQQHL